MGPAGPSWGRCVAGAAEPVASWSFGCRTRSCCSPVLRSPPGPATGPPDSHPRAGLPDTLTLAQPLSVPLPRHRHRCSLITVALLPAGTPSLWGEPCQSPAQGAWGANSCANPDFTPGRCGLGAGHSRGLWPRFPPGLPAATGQPVLWATVAWDLEFLDLVVEDAGQHLAAPRRCLQQV